MQFDSLFQVDTWVEPLADGMEFIAEYNGVADPFGTFFNKSALGPDCRIYIRPGSSSYSFHVIHEPDEKGIACDFVQQAIQLPEITAVGSFPNFPRFRVDEEEKCDPSILSILGEDIYWRRDLDSYPNPVSDYLTVDIPDAKKGDVFVIDMNGQIVRHLTDVVDSSISLHLSSLDAGMYNVEFIPHNNKERLVYTNQLVKVD